MFAATLLLPGALSAQAMQCRVPQILPTLPSIAIPDRDVPARQPAITGYALALSWSPEYCRTRGQDPKAALQCDGRIGEFGFILHGLWPEGMRGGPRWCRRVDLVDAATVRATLCAIPSGDLIAHEWAKHGSCVTRTPAAYFAASRKLWDALRFPDMDRVSRANDGAGPTAGEVRQALMAENDGLPARAIAVETNARGWLDGVKLCLDVRFKPVACSPATRGLRDDTRLRIWRGGKRR